MPPLLNIQAITADEPVEVTQLSPGRATLGREPENDIVIDSVSVSRQHALLFSAGEHWFIQDYGSTNGSKINNIKMQPGQTRLLRDGDVLELAEVVLRLYEVDAGGPAKSRETSLIVMEGDTFSGEIVFDASRSRFVVGGPEADMVVEGESLEVPQLVVAKFGGVLELTVGKSKYPVMLNQLSVNGTANLADRDEVSFAGIRILVYDPSSLDTVGAEKAAGVGASLMREREQSGIYERPNLPEHLKRKGVDGWDVAHDSPSAQAGKKFVFGSPPEGHDVTGTLSVGPQLLQSRMGGMGLSSAQRFSAASSGEQETLPGSAIADKILIIVGIVFVFIVMLVGAYLVLT